MNLKDFIGLDSNKIRRDKELMQLYINYYEAAFSVIPNCAGCSFNSGFKKLKRYANSNKKNINFDKTTNEMKKTKTFLIKPQYRNSILTYVKDKKIHRGYGYNINEDFANELVNAGKSDVFSKLPKVTKKTKSIDVKEEEVIVDAKESDKYLDLSYRKELLPLYSDASERTGKKANSQKKEDIIKFLEENEG